MARQATAGLCIRTLILMLVIAAVLLALGGGKLGAQSQNRRAVRKFADSKPDTVCAQFIGRGLETPDSVAYLVRIDSLETHILIPKSKDSRYRIMDDYYNFIYIDGRLTAIKTVLFHKRCPVKQHALLTTPLRPLDGVLG